MPTSLDETYDRILLGIARERQEYAQRLLQCLAESIRPLRAEELAEILAIQFDTGPVPNYDVNWRPENPEEAILSACSSLITIVDMDSSRVVQFSHFSVKEYLTSKRLADAGEHLSQYHILSHSAHTILAQASLSVLLALDDRIDKERMKNFPFAIYAARHWVDHAQFGDVCLGIKVAMERLFDPAQAHFSAWVWIYDIDHRFREIMSGSRPTPPGAVPLYYATLCGFRDLVEHLIVTHPRDVNAMGGFHATPLHASIVKGNVDVMMLLLEHGADVAAVNLEGFTPLHNASIRGRLDIMSLLLAHRADINSQCKGWTPLLSAVFEGEQKVIRVLLQHGAATDIGDPDGITPLISASINGYLDIVHLLLQNGAGVDSRTKVGRTSLMIASMEGHLDVVRSLLENGARVDSHDNSGQTPLILATLHGHLDIMRLLLQSGAAVELCGNNVWTPLFSASRCGHADVVRLLLHNGAGVDSRTNDGWTSLLSASRNGHLDVVHLLLKNGASVESRDNDGWTSLMKASGEGHLDVVRSLLENGACVESSRIDVLSPSNGASQFPSQCCTAISSSSHRFDSRRPRLLYSSSGCIR